MSGNLSCIGFTFASEAADQAFRGAVERMAAEARERLVVAAGEYALWRSRTGAEVWVHLAPESADGEREIVGLTPFFEGESEVPVRLAARLRRPEDNAFEGAWSAWVAPDADDAGAYPLTVDAVDAAATAEIALPANAVLRVVCFARELAAFAFEDEFLRSDARQVDLAPQAFIPIGLFAAAAGDESDAEAAIAQPSSTALLTGRVVEHARLVNEMTGLPFEWLLVESLEATYDVVVDPACVVCEIRPGGTVQVAGWMVARVLE